MKGSRDRLVLAAFATNTLLAGGNAVAIRFSNRELSPLWGASLRFLLAAILLLALMAVLRIRPPRGRALTGALLYGLFQFAGAFGLGYFALVRLHAGLFQTLLALVPLATLLIAVLQHQERLGGGAVAGTLLGLAGIALVSWDSLGQDVPLLSVIAVLGSVLCFAEAAVLVRRFPPVHPVAMNGIGMAAGAVVLVAGAAATGERLVLPHRPATWLALGYLVAAGSVVVFLLYVFILHNWTASRAAYVMVVIPFVTVILSAWLDSEPIGLGLVAGGLLVLAGVYVGALRHSKSAASSS